MADLTPLELAARHLSLREYAQALACFSRMIAERPHDGRAWFGAGQAAKHLGQAEEALRYLETAAQLTPHDARVLVVYATMLERSGEHARARQQIGRALELDPDLAEGYNKLADWQRKAGELAKALHNYDAGVKALARRLVKRMRNDERSPIIKHGDITGEIWMECAMFGALWLASDSDVDGVAWPTSETAMEEERSEAHRGLYFYDQHHQGKTTRVFLPNYFASFRVWLRNEGVFEYLVDNQGTVHGQLGEPELAQKRFAEAQSFRW